MTPPTLSIGVSLQGYIGDKCNELALSAPAVLRGKPLHHGTWASSGWTFPEYGRVNDAYISCINRTIGLLVGTG
jgi:hypothetical protein